MPKNIKGPVSWRNEPSGERKTDIILVSMNIEYIPIHIMAEGLLSNKVKLAFIKSFSVNWEVIYMGYILIRV